MDTAGGQDFSGSAPWHASPQADAAPSLDPNLAALLAAVAGHAKPAVSLAVGGCAVASLFPGLQWTSAQPEVVVAAATARAVRFDVVLLDPTLAAEVQLAWLSQASRLLAPGGLMIGGAMLQPTQPDAMVRLASDTGLTLQLGDQFWFASVGTVVVPDSFPTNIAGSLGPIHFTNMEQTLGSVADRDEFLRIAGAGIACRHQFGEGRPYSNKLPENFSSPEELLRQVAFTEGFQSQGVTDGASLSFLRNVTMSGRLGILYDRNKGAYAETFSSSRHSAEINKPIIHQHDHFMRQCQFSLGGESIPHPGSIFPFTRHRIEQPVVMINSWDLWCYNHWVNYTLSRFWYRDAFPELNALPIVIGPISRRFQRDYLEMLGLADATIIQYHQTAALELASAYHPTLVDPPQFSAGCINWLREKFLPQADSVPEGYESGLYYISRGDANSRNVINEGELMAILDPYGFKRVEFNRFTVRQQIALMRNARVLIGPHGSSLTNIVYISPGCRVLDMTLTPSAFALIKGGMGGEISYVPGLLDARYYVLPANVTDNPANPHANYGYDPKEFAAICELMMDGLENP